MSVPDNTWSNWMSLQLPPTGTRYCYGYSSPVEGTIVDVWNIVTLIMYFDVRFHLVLLYIGLNCASLSVFLVFEAEQFYSGIVSWGYRVSWGCRRIMCMVVCTCNDDVCNDTIVEFWVKETPCPTKHWIMRTLTKDSFLCFCFCFIRRSANTILALQRDVVVNPPNTTDERTFSLSHGNPL